MNSNLRRFAIVAMEECERQKVGVFEFINLIDAVDYISGLHIDHRPINLSTFIYLGRIIEDKNGNRLRSTPVTFASGGSSASPSMVRELMETLWANIPPVYSPIELVDEWIKQLLWIHPFVDGNGRSAWIMQNYLTGKLFNPDPLTDHFKEN